MSRALTGCHPSLPIFSEVHSTPYGAVLPRAMPEPTMLLSYLHLPPILCTYRA